MSQPLDSGRTGRTPLRVLMIEDSEADAELNIIPLVRGGYDLEWEVVQTADAMQAALQRATWDVILSDFTMPGSALQQHSIYCTPLARTSRF
jgi:CheY-like chemotaxis protein